MNVGMMAGRSWRFSLIRERRDCGVRLMSELWVDTSVDTLVQI